MNENELSKIALDCAFKIHTILGPGLLESVYKEVLAYELSGNNLRVEIEKDIPLKYENMYFDKGFRADIIINEKLIIEIKSVKQLENVHFKQFAYLPETYEPQTGITDQFQ